MDKVNKLINLVRQLREDGAIANVVGTGEKSVGFNIQTETPPVDLRRKKERSWNPFFKNLVQIERRKPPQ
jgi:hypothetical protein